MKYALSVWWSDEDRAYIAKAPDLPGCMADGATPELAVAALCVAVEGWIEAARARGQEVPPPQPKEPFRWRHLREYHDALDALEAMKEYAEEFLDAGEHLTQFRMACEVLRKAGRLP